MIFLLFIEINGYTITTWETILGSFALIVAVGTLVKALKEIRKDGWEPFRDRWITPRKTRRARLDQLIEKFDTFGTRLDEIGKELKTNGGSSVKDLVLGIDYKLEYSLAKSRNRDETATDALFELDAHGNMTSTNCAFRELVNADDQELLYRKYVSRVHDADKPRLLAEIETAITNKMPLYCSARFRVGPNRYEDILLQANADVRSGSILMGFFGTASKNT